MKNLGKIVLLLSLLTTLAMASVSAKVEPNTLHEGDIARYVLTINGSNVKKPHIVDICGNDITATSSQTSIVSINGSYEKSYTLSYDFTPRKDCIIPPVEVEVNSKIEKSNSVKVSLKPRAQDFKADFILSLLVDKKEVFVGEPFKLTLLLKQREGAQAVDSKYIQPDFKGFWLKSQEQSKRVQDGNFTITKLIYTLAPQREGTLHIDSATLKIAQRTGVNNWGTFRPQLIWKSYYSNSLDIQAKALPDNLKIVGEFTLSATVDKKRVNQNEPIKVTLKVQGDGNLEDIESFKPYMNSVNIFDEKIHIDKNQLTQKLVFVSDGNFTIPSFELRYFNIKTQKIEKLKTDPIPIVVNGSGVKKKLTISRDTTPVETGVKKEKISPSTVVYKENYIYIFLAFVIGLIVGIGLMMFKKRVGFDKSKKIDIKNEKMLLIKLLPYKDMDSDVSEIVEALESNIYSKDKKELDKKLLKKLLKLYDIS